MLLLPRRAMLMCGSLVPSRISKQQEVGEGSRQTRERESSEKNANGGGGAAVAMRLQHAWPKPIWLKFTSDHRICYGSSGLNMQRSKLSKRSGLE